MKVTAVVTCHERPDRLASILGCLRYQTRPPDQVLAYHCCLPREDADRLAEHFQDVDFHPVECKGDWGHDKRAQGLIAATGDIVGWFNDDDDYERAYVATLAERIAEGADVAYCDWNEAPAGCGFHYGSSTAGNFLIRTAVARKAGWSGRDYGADGMFINRVSESGAVIAHVEQVLYYHNAKE